MSLLIYQFTSNSLINPIQSTITKNYTNTVTLLSLHDHLSKCYLSPTSILPLSFLIFLMLLISLIVLFYFTVFLDGSAYLLFLSNGSPRTCRLAHLLLPFQLISLSPSLNCGVLQGSVLSLILFNLYFQFSLQLCHNLIPTTCR